MKKLVAISLLIVFSTYLINCGGAATTPAEPGSFSKVKIVHTEEGKSKERDVAFRFTDVQISIAAPAFNIKNEIPYDKVTKITYEKSAHPRVAATLLLSVFFLFSKSKKHWLTVYYNAPEAKEEFVLLRLDKKNYQMIMATLESKTGIEIERYEEK